MGKKIKAGDYKVEISFSLREDIMENSLDEIFEDAVFNSYIRISNCNVGEYIPIEMPKVQ